MRTPSRWRPHHWVASTASTSTGTISEEITSKTETISGSSTSPTYSYLNDGVDIGRITGNGITTWKYGNDANGQRTSVGSTTYDYDAFGNLKVADLGSTTITYDIDGAGRRIGRTIDDGTNVETRRYLLGEGNRLVAEYNESGNLVSQFVYATGRHVPDLMLQGSNIYRIVTDHLGSVRLVVNVANGSVAQRIDYDTWGNGTVMAGATFDQPFGFAGGIGDRDTGLVHFGAREYDLATGRWLQKDPILFRGGDTNLYAYVGGDPVNWIDPSGLTVYLCHDPAQLPLASWFDAQHYWIKTDRYERGQGLMDDGFFLETTWASHGGRSKSPEANCVPVSDVDEECVDRRLSSGDSLGQWGFAGICETHAQSVLDYCSAESVYPSDAAGLSWPGPGYATWPELWDATR